MIEEPADSDAANAIADSPPQTDVLPAVAAVNAMVTGLGPALSTDFGYLGFSLASQIGYFDAVAQQQQRGSLGLVSAAAGVRALHGSDAGLASKRNSSPAHRSREDEPRGGVAGAMRTADAAMREAERQVREAEVGLSVS
jgi:hypothetical protein